LAANFLGSKKKSIQDKLNQKALVFQGDKENLTKVMNEAAVASGCHEEEKRQSVS